jgi:hypothetical protein
MARLTAAQRKRLPASAFAGGIDETKGKGDAKRRRFPVHDKAHARAALRLLPRAKGLSDEERKRIRARARAKLGGGGLRRS